MLDCVIRHDADVQSVHRFLSHDLVELDAIPLAVGLLKELLGRLKRDLRILDHEERLLQLKGSVQLLLVESLLSSDHLSSGVRESVLVG